MFFAAGSICACSALDQRAKSTFEDDIVFSNYALARYAVNAIYESYITMATYRTDYFEYYGANTDVEIRYSAEDAPQNNYCQYKMTLNNIYFDKSGDDYPYAGNFKGIERANLCIKGLKEYGNIDEDKQMGALYGEALTVRAMLYTDLMNYYGEVPARFEPINQETIYLPKADKDVLYKHLLSDLETAAKYLDYNNQKLITVPGKACANGMYARIALQAAGYSRRPDVGKVNTGDMGSVRKSYDPELQASVLYPKALAALKDVIDNAHLGLYENYEDMWRFYCDMGAEYGTVNNPEIIFGLPFDDNRGQHLIRNCMPDDRNKTQSGYRITLNPALYFKFDKEDTRRDITCCFHKYDKDGKADLSSASASNLYVGKYRQGWRSPGHEIPNKDSDDGCKFTYLRYADILLMAAEIANELGNLDEAKAYMRPVLVRAYKSEVLADKYLDRLVDKDTFFNAIKDQRAFEFAGELLRRADLIRWGILKESLDKAKSDMRLIQAHDGKYKSFLQTFYWRVKADGEPEIFGLNPGETGSPASDGNGTWKTKKFWSSMSNNRINNMYIGDPDIYMYRPIPPSILITNLGVLKNDYGYTY